MRPVSGKSSLPDRTVIFPSFNLQKSSQRAIHKVPDRSLITLVAADEMRSNDEGRNESNR